MVDEFIDVINIIDVNRSREIYSLRYNLEKEYIDDNYYKSIDDIDLDFFGLEKDEVYKDLDNYKIYYRYLELDEARENTNNISDDITSNTDNINITKPISSNINLVKTGIKKNKNYNHLITYIFSLILMALLFVKLLNKKRNFK